MIRKEYKLKKASLCASRNPPKIGRRGSHVCYIRQSVDYAKLNPPYDLFIKYWPHLAMRDQI